VSGTTFIIEYGFIFLEIKKREQSTSLTFSEALGMAFVA